MGHSALRNHLLLLILSGAIPASAVAAIPREGGGLVASISEWCPPQIGACVAHDHPCARVAPPDRRFGIVVRVTRDGAPVAGADVRLAEGERPRTTTDADGVARVSLPPTEAPVLLLEAGSDREEVPVPAFWGRVVVEQVGDLPTVPVGAEAVARVAARLEGRGIPPSVALPITMTYRASPDAIASASFAGGLAQARLTTVLDGVRSYPVLDVDACGLPLLGEPRVRAIWTSPPPARAAPPPPPPAPAEEDEPIAPSLALPEIAAWQRKAPADVPFDATGEVLWRLDGGAWRAPPIRVPEGVHRVEAFAFHEGGAATASVERTYRVDAEPPGLVLEGAGAGWSPCQGAAIAASDALSGVDPARWRVSVDGRAVPGAPENGRVVLRLPDGVRHVGVEAEDAAGNVAMLSSTVRCDSAPPTLQLRVPGARVAGWLTERAIPEVRASDATSRVTLVRLREGSDDWVSPGDLVIEGEGERRIEAEAFDEAGNRGTVTMVLRVDTGPPTIDAPAIVSADATRLVVRVADGGIGVQSVRLRSSDGASRAGLALPDGAHVFDLTAVPLHAGARLEIAARDAAGHDAVVAIDVAEPPAPLPRPATAPSATIQLAALIVTPREGAVTDDVRVSATARGVAGGTLLLIDEQGERTALGPVRVEGDSIVAVGRAPREGTYRVALDLEADDGTRFVHEVGNVTLVPPSPYGKIPFLAIPLAIAALLLAAARRPRRR